jgi:mannosyl-oligosaccharide alpha-1,2-mannosidase
MLFIRRGWLLPGVFFVIVLYYVFFSRPDEAKSPFNSSFYGPNGEPVHWAKRPERYPVSEFRALPSGTNKGIPRIQHSFGPDEETQSEKRTREERKAKVKETFLHSWNGYKKFAYGKDEVAPVTATSRSSFGGWGATLVDAMDTLWLMGLTSDFDMTVEFVKTIDFTINTEWTLNIFETTIRYLGGLLAAYDLTDEKYPILLSRAEELGEMLYSAFDTPNRMPACRWPWKMSAIGQSITAAGNTLLAEIGSLTLEFTRLAQLTGDNKYFDAIERIMEHMYLAQKSTQVPGLWPTIINATTPSFQYNHFTFSGMADSTYEYLPKEYILLGGQDPKYRTMYEAALESAKSQLFFRPLVPINTDMLFSGNIAVSNSADAAPGETELDPQGQHLTCFAAGMVAIGSRIFSRPDDLSIAKRLLEGCLWAYSATPSGLMPETFHLAPCHRGTDAVPEQSSICDWSEERWFEAVAERQGMTQATKEMTPIERGKHLAKDRNILPGFTDHGDSRYLLRPEAIESVFILYRVTGDKKYLDDAWRMFLAIETATRTEVAHAAISDVRDTTVVQSDSMESFWLAETLKYFYLIFSDPEDVSLDEWVLNTEAHPFKRPGWALRNSDDA